MKFRTRLVLTLSATTALTFAASFGATAVIVEHSEERQLDEAIHFEAHEEAAEAAQAHSGKLRISDRGGPVADDVGRLTKYAAIYAADGRVLDATSTFGGTVPPLDAVRHPPGVAFDLTVQRERLRAMLVPLPDKSGATLLLAAPRSDLEKDTIYLREVLLVAALLAIASTVLVTRSVVRHLTQGHEAIGRTARAVAAGDLDARVALTTGDDEVVQLARDVDEMVSRLAVLVESQQQFIAHAAHELRSPLTSLYGELQLALRRSRSAEEYKAAIEEAFESARRLKILAEDLLALARIGADRQLASAPFALEDVAQAAAAWVRPEVERRRLSLAITTDGASMVGHAIDIERLMRNLLENAVRHSPDGGAVKLDVKHAGDEILVSVLDEGPGVREEDRERIFTPFYRGATEHAREDGSGLGLAIVREIARVHGGEVTVDRGPDDKGALFRARFALGQAAPHAEADRLGAAPLTSG